MKRKMTIEWEIHDTRNMNGGFRTGTSVLITESKDAINQVISFASHLPISELERNGIDLKEYREGNICTYYYMTMITRIIRVEIVR